jgi:Putative phage tail protein
MSSKALGNVVRVAGIAAAVVLGPGSWVGAAVLFGSGILGGAIDGSLLAREQSGVQLNVTSNEASLPVVYGIARVGLKILETRIDTSVANNNSIFRVGAFCVSSEDGSGIQGVLNVYFDEVVAIINPAFEGEPNNTGIQVPWETGPGFGDKLLAQYGLHSGADTQVVDSELDTAFTQWGSTDKGVGIAYLSLNLFREKDVYPRGLPNITVEVSGNKIYDPRSSTWAWHDNPALCILDYLTSKRYGVGAAYSERDGGSLSEIDEQSFINAANHCDELVSVPGGTQKRFRCNGWLDTGAELGANIRALETSCRGRVVYQGGKFRLVIRQVQSTETYEITEADIVGPVEIVRAGTAGTANRVMVSYIDADAQRQPNDVSWPEADTSNGFLLADNGWENAREIALRFTDDRYMAQQIGMVELRESRADTRVAVPVKEEALKLQVGEVVNFSLAGPGWTQKPFWVDAIDIAPDRTVILILEEYDATTYSLDTLNTKDTPPGTNLPAYQPGRGINGLQLRYRPTTDGTFFAWAVDLYYDLQDNAASMNVSVNYTLLDPPNPASPQSYNYDINVSGQGIHTLDDGIGGVLYLYPNVTTVLEVTATSYDGPGGAAGGGRPGKPKDADNEKATDSGSVGVILDDGSGTPIYSDRLMPGDGVFAVKATATNRAELHAKTRVTRSATDPAWADVADDGRVWFEPAP